MKPYHVLIVDDEASLLLSFRNGFERLKDRYRLYTAENGKKALEILETASIDICVTDIRMPVMDGFELLVVMNARFPTIPVIVMSAYGSPELEEQLESIGGTVRFLEKPMPFERLLECIEESLRRGAQSGAMIGISVGSFLQLLEMEEKTALIEVQTTGKKGLFYFCQGMLYDAVCREKTGEDAAIEMMMWERVKIQFKRLPEKKIVRRVQTEIMPLLLEASRRKDENQSESEMDEADIEGVEPESISENAKPLSDFQPQKAIGLSSGQVPAFTDPDAGRSAPSTLRIYEKAIENVASEIRAAAYTGIFDSDGIPLVEIAATSSAWHALPARMAELVQTALHAVQEIGISVLQEVILETDTHWLLCRPFTPSLCLVAVCGKKTQLGAIRLAISHGIEQITSDPAFRA